MDNAVSLAWCIHDDDDDDDDGDDDYELIVCNG